ncbi:MAG TPA: polymer-forming cytoskeletal protein [Defluviitaleaceae bacterium]|mgnify:CR=1 FL=1|nr:polymer-forming cytoskeletal protein [Candidatus Epulonipiscium sp.]HOQ17765.1 polymer-forming cytoskeletal protein [Defluviitaleaceae bacterium]HPT76708.1 polymer-forming cytoskeletal protein [Defluviitaleaceae bacterium]HQD50619.1 polymer-forming cytoskeletal protein [Defluviitaleaceae bacterium]
MKKTGQKKFDNYSTIIGENTILESEYLKSNETVRIDGKYKGEIILESDLVIGEKGLVEGSVKANNIEISGTVVGDINSKELVYLTATAKVKGNISCNNLVIDDGAKISGFCNSGNLSNSSDAITVNDNQETKSKKNKAV